MTTRGHGRWEARASECAGTYGPGIDRPWLASYGNDRLYVVYGEEGTGTAIDISNDGGQSFQHRTAISSIECGCFDAPGFITIDQRDGTIYLSYIAWTGNMPDTLKVAVSSDGGNTFQYRTVVRRQGLNLRQGGFPPITVDRSGNVYIAWSDTSEGRFAVWLSVSRDRGINWSKPLRVSKENGHHFFPWMVAGNDGMIAVAWWGTIDDIRAPWLARNAKWYVYAAVSFNALETAPGFQEALVSDEPFHVGSLCAHTDVCESGDKGVEGLPKDFFQIDIDADGRVSVVWPDTAHYNGQVHAHFAKQVGTNVIPEFPVSPWLSYTLAFLFVTFACKYFGQFASRRP